MPDFALPRRVLKFGGSSLTTPERIKAAAQISSDAFGKHRIAVVVSAWGGVTDDLVASDIVTIPPEQAAPPEAEIRAARGQ